MEDRRNAEFKEWNRDRFVEFQGNVINLPIKVDESDIQKLINRLEQKPIDYVFTPFYRLAKERNAKGDVNVSVAKRNDEIFFDMTLSLRKEDDLGDEKKTVIKDVPITDYEYEKLIDIADDFCTEMYGKHLDEELDDLDENHIYGFGGINEDGKYYFIEDGNYGDESVIPTEDIKEYVDIEELTEMVMESKALKWMPYESQNCVKQLMEIFLEDKIDDVKNSQSIPVGMKDVFIDMMEFNYDRWNQNLLSVINYENADEFVIDMNENPPRLFAERGNIKKVKGRNL